MAKLPVFDSLESKRLSFDYNDFTIIDTKRDFDEWFERYHSDNKQGFKVDYIYRGMKEAKHKLFTSAQRQWIANDMDEWYPKSYLEYINDLVERTKRKPLLKKVFDLYGYELPERDLPILSILQHYGAPTPLMDWTHNLNVALFFATDNLPCGNGNDDIDGYFSIYFVNKTLYKDTFKHLYDLLEKKHPSIEEISNAVENHQESKQLYYITDFEASGRRGGREFKVNTRKPITSIFNQNIIAQEGLFVLNPHHDLPIDELLINPKLRRRYDTWNRPFSCFNIKKDLADYVRRRIKNKLDNHGDPMDIDKSFIYPRLSDVVPVIHDGLLNENII